MTKWGLRGKRSYLSQPKDELSVALVPAARAKVLEERRRYLAV